MSNRGGALLGDYKLEGTTIVGVKFGAYIIIGSDTRQSARTPPSRDYSLCGNTYKYCDIGHGVVVAIAGNAGYAIRVMKHMKEYLQTHESAMLREIGEHAKDFPRTETEIKNKICCSLMLSRIENGNSMVYVLNYNNENGIFQGELSEVSDFCAIGHGEKDAERIWKKCLADRQLSTLSLDEVHQYVQSSLIGAALYSAYTGGYSIVVQISQGQENTIEEVSRTTTIDFLINNYNVFANVGLSCVLLIYQADYYPDNAFKADLSKNGKKIRELGHPLNRLRGGYYVQRVRFQKKESVKEMFRIEATATHALDDLPFTTLPSAVKLLGVAEHDSSISIYIMHHTEEALRSLLLEEDKVDLLEEMD